MKRATNLLIDASLVLGAVVLCCFAPVFMDGPDELDSIRAVADEVRAAPTEARQMARAEVLDQAAERYAHPSASKPLRKRHPSTSAESSE